MYRNFTEAQAEWNAHRVHLERRGIIVAPTVRSYLPEDWAMDESLAQDAQPSLVTPANSGIPYFLTTLIDPQVFKILLAPNKMAEIIGEKRKGSWLDQTQMFPTVERTGEVSSYGDFNENGRAGLNTFFPQRQSYLFQTMIEYGELELERAGLAKIGWVKELQEAAAVVLAKFLNLTYAFGVQGGQLLQNYGLLNDPNLSAALTPGAKAYGGNKWINNGVIVATANEIYLDVQSLYIQLVNQTQGIVNVDEESSLVLALAPAIQVALTAANSFNVSVRKLLTDNFPKLKIKTAVQYAQTSASNPQGIAAGNLVQLICEDMEGQETSYCSFNEKMRQHRVIQATSSFHQKVTSGSWGAIIRQPFGIAQMLGV